MERLRPLLATPVYDSLLFLSQRPGAPDPDRQASLHLSTIKRVKSRLLGLVLASTPAAAISGCATRLSSSANHDGQGLKANPADVDTITDIVRASYEPISGPALHLVSFLLLS